ncbi:MAG TPA: helix-turn-helix domain-containing protein [Albitalea sp.]|uniref:TetR/AcrR family transcriptional regulator n=1 Tax=Piscinibacter sp. TaxID=1903157 RepID=UPI002ED348F8
MAIALDAPPLLTDHRRRLLDAMSEVVARKGYAEVTIADLAAEARVSRRTFYEHFASKAECLIALYDVASGQALRVLRDAIDPQRDWHLQVEQAIEAYLSCLASSPALLRTLFIAILGLGPEGLAARRRANLRLADFILEVVNQPPRAKPLPAAFATGIVGAINELILEAIEQDAVDKLPEMTAVAAHLARAVIDEA